MQQAVSRFSETFYSQLLTLHAIHTARRDATRQFCRVGSGGVNWVLQRQRFFMHPYFAITWLPWANIEVCLTAVRRWNLATNSNSHMLHAVYLAVGWCAKIACRQCPAVQQLIDISHAPGPQQQTRCRHDPYAGTTYAAMRCSSVCPSPFLSNIALQTRRAAGLLLWARCAGDIDQLLHGLRRSSTAVSSKGEQCRVYIFTGTYEPKASHVLPESSISDSRLDRYS